MDKDPPSQINESPACHIDVSSDSVSPLLYVFRLFKANAHHHHHQPQMDASSACATVASPMDQNVPSIGGFFATTMLEGVNKVYMMVDQSIKTQTT
jgi:hypothetical protein